MVFEALLAVSVILNIALAFGYPRTRPAKLSIDRALDAVEDDPDLRKASTVRRLKDLVSDGR